MINQSIDNNLSSKNNEDALRQELEAFRLILDFAPIGIWLQNGKGKVSVANKAFCNAIGIAEKDFIAASHYAELLPEAFREQCLASDEKALKGSGVSISHQTLPFVDGKVHDLRIIKALKRDANGHPEFLVGLSFDITEELAQQKALDRHVNYIEILRRLSTSLINLPLTQLDNAIKSALAEVGQFFDADRAYIFDYDLTNATASNTFEWCSDGIKPQIETLQQVPLSMIPQWFEQHQKGETLLVTSVDKLEPGFIRDNLTAQGIHSLVCVPIMINSRCVGFVGLDDVCGRTNLSREESELLSLFAELLVNLTERKQSQAQLEHIAHYDLLTHLPNRLLLADRLRQSLIRAHETSQTVAVAYLDLDGFKSINDRYGHAMGDQLLIIVAERMRDTLKEGDTLARIGGDEFVAVFTHLDNDGDNEAMFNQLLEAASKPVTVDETLLNVTASLGISFYPQGDEVDADQLLRQADQAMYQAKQTGKNRFHLFDPEHDRSVRGRHKNLQQIRQALTCHEFVLYYQPKVDMSSGQVLGAEALIRWQHPQRGLLSPADFLPIIENHPIAIDLGNWVIETALEQIEFWRQQGLSIPISVNVGALQLQHPNFTTYLKNMLLQHTAIQLGELELEILETSALEDFVAVSQVMTACQDMGISFAVDDFGTGYSSLTYLKQLPAATLKIDQSFVRDMLEDPDDLAILKGVLGLAQAFNRHAVAEGVESIAHGEMLLELGCCWGQGYAIAKPMPSSDFPNWMSTWKQPDAWQKFKTD